MGVCESDKNAYKQDDNNCKEINKDTKNEDKKTEVSTKEVENDEDKKNEFEKNEGKKNKDNTIENNANQENENIDNGNQDTTNQDKNDQGLENNIEVNNNKEEGNNKNEEDKKKQEEIKNSENNTKIKDNKNDENNNKEGFNNNDIKDENNKKEDTVANIKKENEKLKVLMKNTFCKIMLNNKELGTGFFCTIKFSNINNPILVLIINGVIIKENNAQGKSLNIILNENKGIFLLPVDNNRIIYEDNDSNITIIEIKNYFSNLLPFEIDENLNKDKYEDLYNIKYIVLIDYSFKENNKLEFNFEYNLGLSNINKILSENENKYEDGIIINSLNNKIIGLIKKKSGFLL